MRTNDSVQRDPNVVVLKGAASLRSPEETGPSYSYPSNGLPKLIDTPLTAEELEYAKRTCFLVAREAR